MGIGSSQTDRVATQGRNHDYVFIPGDLAEKDFAQVTVVLPGCTALVERRSDDVYIICALEISDDFEQAQNDEELRTGMRFVRLPSSPAISGEDPELEVLFCKNGRMKESAVRQSAMVIGNLRYSSASQGAKEAAKIVGEAYGLDGSEKVKKGFHYSHHTFKRGSNTLKNHIPIAQLYAPSEAHACRSAAMMLAESVRSARPTDGLHWMCEGSGAITALQAITLLSAEGMNLSNHKLRLYDSPANLAALSAAAMAAGMKIEASHLGKQGLRRPIAAATYFRACHIIRKQQMESAQQNKKGSTVGYIAAHISHADALAGSLLNGVNMVSLSVGALGLAAGSPQVSAVAGAVAAANTAYKISAGTVKGANKLVKDVAPKMHDKIKERFK